MIKFEISSTPSNRVEINNLSATKTPEPLPKDNKLCPPYHIQHNCPPSVNNDQMGRLEFISFLYTCAIDQTWLGVRCHPEAEFEPLLFSHSWTTHGPESTCWSGNCRCFTEKWPKIYVTYVRFWFDFEKSSVLHIFAHWACKFWAMSIYLISVESYWHRLSHGCKILCVRWLTNAQ